jgi:hypothetical protein
MSINRTITGTELFHDALMKMSERVFQRLVVEAAERRGWMVYHTYDSRRSRAGYPDLTMVRGGVVIFAELKKMGEKPKPEQKQWLDALPNSFFWVPTDMDAIKTLLSDTTL